MTIYYMCPDIPSAGGGIKQIYRHVDILNRNGIPAFVLHKNQGFKISFFKNQTKIAYSKEVFKNAVKIWIDRVKDTRRLRVFYRIINRIKDKIFNSDIKLRKDDILVVPEIYGPRIGEIAKGIKKIIFNQNCHYTFDGYSLDIQDKQTPYRCPDVAATLVISDHSLKALAPVFPEHTFLRVHSGIDEKKFYFSNEKKRQIAFMPRKLSEDALQVINILKFRNTLNDFKLVAIDGLSEEKTAEILRESLIFLSFSDREGCPLPPMEAMACGCIVVGYHGYGGKEYFFPEFSYPVPQRDTFEFSKILEQVIRECKESPDVIFEKREKSSAHILKEYSMQREEREVLDFWRHITDFSPKSFNE